MANIGGTRIWYTGQGNFTVVASHQKVVRELGPNGGKLHLIGPVATDRLIRSITHAVWKIGLEFVYLDHGANVAFDPKFDPVREAVIGVRDSPGWCVIPRDCKAAQQVRSSYVLHCVVDGQERVPIVLDVFGVVFISDLLAVDAIKPPWPATVWSFGKRRRP